MSEANDLVKLQEIDLDMMRLRRKLKELPQIESRRKVIAKLDEVQEKSKKISAMRSECELEMHKLADEDHELLQKAERLEKEIQELSDFRSVTHRTRDLEGISKRRNKIDFDLAKLSERVQKISSVEDQISETNKKLDAQRVKLDSEISAISNDAAAKMAELEAEYSTAASGISHETLSRYENLKKTKNGIAVGVLQGEHCSVCRVEFPEGKLVKLFNGPEITTCPQCHRILVVTKGDDAIN